MSLLVALRDTLLLPVTPLACALSLALLSFLVFLFRDYLVPLTVRYYLLLYYCLVCLAGGPFTAGRSYTAGYPSIAIICSYVSPMYIVLDF